MNGNRGTILIAEDSMTQAEQLRHVLEKNGYTAAVARNGREALEKVRQVRPVLIISDIIMPELDGFSLCSGIKKQDDTRDIPVMLLTSLAESHDVLKGLQCGADSFLTKPYDEPYLLSRIRHLLYRPSPSGEPPPANAVELHFQGERYVIRSDRKQILDLLLSVYEAAVRRTGELSEARRNLEALNDELETKVDVRTAQLMAEIEERKQAERELTRYRRQLEELVEKRTEELRETVARLEQSNRDLEQFAYVASHDLQEPLRMVASYMQLLQRRYSERLDEKAETYINYAVDGAARMQKLIEGLLNYSRLSRGAEFTPVNTNAVFEGALANLKRVVQESGGEVNADPLPTVLGDETQLLQLFQNLMANALKYRKPGIPPRVQVSAHREGAEWVFSVRDNGIGIEPQHKERIFQIFQRLHTLEEYPGTGIGLASCKKIVERHHGRMWVEAEPGAGSTFLFSLPAKGADGDIDGEIPGSFN